MSNQLTKRNGNGRTRATLLSFPRDFDDIIGRMLSRDWEWGDRSIPNPSMNISETEGSYRATLELPGVQSDDIDIQVNGNVLTVSGETRNVEEEAGRTFHRVERSCGSFSRSVALPCEVAEDQVTAKLEVGVLTIELPKAEDSKPSKIAIQGA